jgi:tRNA (cytidine/uridine-2'-O-)-methyltransferase
MGMRIALYQPDIPQNTGTIIRMAACLGLPIDIILPCGFPFSDRAFKRAGMDYLDQANLTRHMDWQEFETARTVTGGRLILLTTKAEKPYTRCIFRPDDILLLGRESSGVPRKVHDAADELVLVPMAAGMRSLNVAVAAAMVVGEALRQIENRQEA